jgi:hypothetical protein
LVLRTTSSASTTSSTKPKSKPRASRLSPASSEGCIQNKRTAQGGSFLFNWSGIKDSNLRPRGPKPRALANCANPRRICVTTGANYNKRLQLLLDYQLSQRRQVLYNKYEMKYASIFVTILLVWIAVILMALTTHNETQIFELYLAVIANTVILFLIGFARR